MVQVQCHSVAGECESKGQQLTMESGSGSRVLMSSHADETWQQQ